MRLIRYQEILVYVVGFLSAWWTFGISKREELRTALLQSLQQEEAEDTTGDGNSSSLSSSLLRLLARRTDVVLLAVDWAPVLAVVVLGLYALSSLVVGVIRFNDRPDAAVELEAHVREAKKELKKRGISIQ